ncbi:MAG: UbiD family decarboxylase [Desulfobacteraceae bacterium]|nr:UbiD family decarboxylase [Desulfobacteraceae bacterium]MBC2758076.1 UbiD family decarboxylase [Desulfobacteraceae bacterium]
MTYSCTKALIDDLDRHGHLVRIKQAVDPNLEMAEIQRRVYAAGGPAIFFENVKSSPFPAVSNIFGTLDRAGFIFRNTLSKIQRLIELNADPFQFLKSPLQYLNLPVTLWHMLPKKVSSGPVFQNTTTIDRLPQIKCWPDDGGPFILLPQVYTEDPARPGIMHSNLGMYRIQLSGNAYQTNKEIGLHYQIRRDIGGHHAAALEMNQPLRVSIFIGGPPSHAFSAVMPLPEGMPEVTFAGGLAGRRFRYMKKNGFTIAADADFCITGTMIPKETKPEGPFGDHLGYYSLKHPFPVICVDNVYHRSNAVWPFTVVGRPPQEDTVFGQLIHEITGPMVPKSIPGVEAIHAVDAAGVHPLLLAIGKERYLPYDRRKPRELLKISNALLGFGACALAKYLIITAQEDNPNLNIHNIKDFFQHVLERVDWKTDLHFQTETTIDTLDYSGTGLNEGSKVIIAAAGPPKKQLMTSTPAELSLPDGFSHPQIALPGVLIIQAKSFSDIKTAAAEINSLVQCLHALNKRDELPLVVLADDAGFTAKTLNNFLWTTFTRSNPSHDIYGINSFTKFKHWGCEAPLIIDARLKPHHAPPLVEDPEITARVDELGKKGGPLYGII